MTTPRLTLNLVEGSVAFPFPAEAAQDLKKHLTALMESLKATVTQTSSVNKTAPKQPMEYQYTGSIFLEIFCNPNIWPSPFAAKALITLRDEQIRLTTEAELSRIIEDINQYLEQIG